MRSREQMEGARFALALACGAAFGAIVAGGPGLVVGALSSVLTWWAVS